jgi:hypothetical protein
MTNRNKTIMMTATVAVLSLALLSGTIMQQAFAHANTSLTVSGGPADGKKIRVTVGHTNEPTYGAAPGIHDGKHNFEVILADSATRLPVAGSGTNLKIDKYYFKNIKTFEKAKSVNDADEIQKEITLGSVFGDPGRYMARQVQKDGIYGYRIYGTINYYGVASVPLDSTVFCAYGIPNQTTKFNSAGWAGTYGCTENIKDTAFPSKNSDLNKVSLDLDANGSGTHQIAASPSAATTATVPIVQQTASTPIGLQLLMFGLPAAAVASYFGIRTLRNHKRDQAL